MTNDELIAEARCAHTLRGMVRTQVHDLSQTYSRLFHQARQLRASLTDEHYPLGFLDHEVGSMVRELDYILGAKEETNL